MGIGKAVVGSLATIVAACVEPDLEFRFKYEVPLAPGPCRSPEVVEGFFGVDEYRYQEKCDKLPRNCGLGKGSFPDLKWLSLKETDDTFRSMSSDGGVLLVSSRRLYDPWAREELLPGRLQELRESNGIWPDRLTSDGRYLVATQEQGAFLSEKEVRDPATIKTTLHLIAVTDGSLQHVVDLRELRPYLAGVTDDARWFWISDMVCSTEGGSEQKRDGLSEYLCPAGGKPENRDRIFDRETNLFSPFDRSKWDALKGTPRYTLKSGRNVDPKNEEIYSDNLDVLDNTTQEDIDIPDLDKISGLGGRNITADGRYIVFDHLVSPTDRDLCIYDRGPQD